MNAPTHPTYDEGDLVLVGDAVGWITGSGERVEVGEVGTVTAVSSTVIVVGGTDRIRPKNLTLLARAGEAVPTEQPEEPDTPTPSEETP